MKNRAMQPNIYRSVTSRTQMRKAYYTRIQYSKFTVLCSIGVYTMALVCSKFGREQSLTLVKFDTPPRQNPREYICVLIFLETNYNQRPTFCPWQYGSIFIQIFLVVVSSVKLLYFCKSNFSAVQGHQRSFIIIFTARQHSLLC